MPITERKFSFSILGWCPKLRCLNSEILELDAPILKDSLLLSVTQQSIAVFGSFTQVGRGEKEMADSPPADPLPSPLFLCLPRQSSYG